MRDPHGTADTRAAGETGAPAIQDGGVTDAERFLLALARDDLPPDERMILCAFIGDPNTAGTHAWRPRPYKPGNEIVVSEKANGYTTCASFKRSSDGTFRRRQDVFGAGLALMVDDVGTKVTAKPGWPRASVEIETSPGNWQWWYLLSERCTDIVKFDEVIRAFIAGELLGNDPGMAGVNRVGRLPGFINGKPKYVRDGKEWVCAMREFDSDRRYSIAELMSAFNLKGGGSKYAGSKTKLVFDDHKARVNAWADVYSWLRSHKMVKAKFGPDKSGWTEIHCPWIDDHTDRADTGAAIREPASENDWYGAFQCHHGHCKDKTWRELTDWLANEVAIEIAETSDPGFDAIFNAVPP
ncbi:MAG TPA: DNA-primase RepB domain-containing protein [Abditibacteriaceae bacterium]